MQQHKQELEEEAALGILEQVEGTDGEGEGEGYLDGQVAGVP